MIKFFRRIRQTLLSENKFRKYLVYAIGEIALVMIGILLALQVSNWNENRKQKELISSYITSLVGDLQNDIDQLKNTEEINLFRYHSSKYLLRTAGLPEYQLGNDGPKPSDWQQASNFIWEDDVPTDYDTNFVQLALVWSSRIGYPNFSRSTIEELHSTGLLSQLPSAVKDAIRSYYDNIDFRYGTREAFQPVAEDWLEALQSHGILNSNSFIYGDPVRLISTNKLLSGRMRRLIRQAGWLAESAPVVTENSEGLIELLQGEIK